MRYLVDKYPDGYEGYAREHGLDVGTSKSDIVEARILANSLAAHSNSAVAPVSDGDSSVLPANDYIQAQDGVPN